MIKRNIDNCIEYFRKNSMFRKIVLLFIAAGIAIFLLFSIVTILLISRTSSAQMNATEKKMLFQSCNTANQILRDIHSLVNSKFEDDAAIRTAMTSPYSVEGSIQVQSAFDEIMASSSLISSIYVINFSDNVAYSTDTSAKSIAEFFDTDIIEYLKSNPPRSNIFFPRSVDLDAVDSQHENYITSVYRNSNEFALVVNIDQELFQSLINLTSDRQSYDTVIINSSGTVISHTNAEFFARDMSADPLFEKVLSSGKDSGSFSFKGSSVNFVRSDTLGYSYVSISSSGGLLSDFVQLLLALILFTLVLIVIYSICSVLAFMHSYSMFSSLKKSIYSMLGKSEFETDDEMEHIAEVITEAKIRYRSMETVQYQYMNTKQSETLQKLLSGTFMYLQDDMTSCNITFPHQDFAAVVMCIDDVNRLDPETIGVAKYAVANIGKEIFEKDCSAYSTETGDYYTVFILNFTSGGFIEGAIEKINLYMKKFFEVTFSAAYDCAVLDSFEDVSTLYHNARHALSYKLVKGYSSIIKYSDIIPLDNTVPSYPKELEQAIIKNITAQSDNELVKNIKTFISLLENISYNAVLLFTDRLLLAIDQLAISSNMRDEDIEIPANIQEAEAYWSTLDDIERYISGKCRSIMLKLSSVKLESSKDIIVQNVLKYIDENYTNPNLSIDMIAGEINRSANYIRSVFKNSQNISISDYIAKKRFDEVCRMLVETNLTAQEIGTRIGLNSGSYFYTSFKKHTGYTPDQYRRLYRKND